MKTQGVYIAGAAAELPGRTRLLTALVTDLLAEDRP